MTSEEIEGEIARHQGARKMLPAPLKYIRRRGGGSVMAVTRDALTYAKGSLRYRATVNNDGGAVAIWEVPTVSLGSK